MGRWSVDAKSQMARKQTGAVMDQYPTAGLQSTNDAGAYSESMACTFGANREASRRLRRLAEVYEPETRELLNAEQPVCHGRSFELALDLGSGPGWSICYGKSRSSSSSSPESKCEGCTIPSPRPNASQIFITLLGNGSPA